MLGGAKSKKPMRVLMTSITAAMIAVSAQSQSVPRGSADAQFTGLAQANASISITPKAGSTDLGVMSFTGNGQGGTNINFDFSRLAPSKQTLRLYSGQMMIRELPIPNGPAGPELDISYNDKPVHEATLSNGDDDWWWVVIAVVVMWCVHTESSTTTNYDASGNVTGSSTTESTSWDCSGGISVNVNGQVFQNVTRMDVIAETSTVLPPVSSTTFAAAGGSRITSLR